MQPRDEFHFLHHLVHLAVWMPIWRTGFSLACCSNLRTNGNWLVGAGRVWSGDVAGTGTAEVDSSTHCMAILKISKMMKVEDKCL